MRKLLLLIVGFAVVSCSSKEELPQRETNSSFKKVYEFSEMALLMEKMYSELEKQRPNIMEGKSMGEFPKEFPKIHTAKLTPGFERTNEFTRFADLYLQQVELLYNSKPEDSKRVEYYNNAVKACISCHKSDAGCMGPVSRIGKLLIEN